MIISDLQSHFFNSVMYWITHVPYIWLRFINNFNIEVVGPLSMKLNMDQLLTGSKSLLFLTVLPLSRLTSILKISSLSSLWYFWGLILKVWYLKDSLFVVYDTLKENSTVWNIYIQKCHFLVAVTLDWRINNIVLWTLLRE
jgi:hypothetical protein